MTGLILKDYLVMQKTLRYYLLLMAIYSLLVFTGAFTYSIISGFTVMLGAVAPMSAFAYDEQAKWDKFAAATPVGRRGVVKARYLYTLILLLGGGVLSTLVSMAVVNFGKAEVEAWWEPIVVVTVVLLVGVALNAAILPVLFKFGAEKSRVISLIIFVTVFGGMALLAMVTDSSGQNPLRNLGDALAALPPALLIAAPVAVIFALFWLSYRVSVGIYQKKEL